jgi:hypothetical protein
MLVHDMKQECTCGCNAGRKCDAHVDAVAAEADARGGCHDAV